MNFDHLLVARILFTLMTAGYAVGTVIADFNATHATNPKWTPHDDNGYQPFAAPVPIFTGRWDANITAFSVQLVLLAGGLTALAGWAG